MTRENKTATLAVRLQPSAKQLLQQLAESDRRSISGWIEHQIHLRAAQRGLRPRAALRQAG
jgi:uncharacterized protein (DUF1778 family)